MSAHTPGPWHVGTKEAHHCVYDAHGWCIADASPQGKDSETPSNARLIAAAPELLRTLALVVADWSAQFERNGHMAPAWCKQAREAIAKAIG